jgi:hypothetical protein
VLASRIKQITMKLRELNVKCYDNSCPIININTRRVPYFNLESESDSENEHKDEDYAPIEDEPETESECDSEDDISDSEDGSNYESETEPESDSEEVRIPEPYHTKGYTVYFDSVEDKAQYFKDLNKARYPQLNLKRVNFEENEKKE